MSSIKKWDRYINNKLLSCVQRPQPYNFCSLAVIQEILLFFDIEKSYLEIMSETGIWKSEVIAGKIGNSRLQDGLRKYKLGAILYNKDNKINWHKFKLHLMSDFPMILHRKGHYSLVVGYIEEPLLINSGDNVTIHSSKIQKWIVLGEHRVKNKTVKENGMIELYSWDNYQKLINSKNNYGVIVCFERD